MKEDVATVMGRFGRLSAGVYRRAVGSHTCKEPGVIFHLGGGDLQVTLGGSVERFRAGDMLTFDSWTAHSRTMLSNVSSTLVTLLADPLLCGAVTGTRRSCRFMQTRASIDAELRAHLERIMVALFDRSDADARVHTLQTDIERLIELVRARHVRAGRSESATAADTADARVLHAFERLRANAVPKASVESTVAASGMSRSNFFRQFRRTIGVSPQHVIDQCRIDYALDALSGSDLMLSQLSAHLGFSAPAHFTRFFVQHLGCTPSRFRRRLMVV